MSTGLTAGVSISVIDFVVVSKRTGAARVEVEMSIVSIPNITEHLKFNC